MHKTAELKVKVTGALMICRDSRFRMYVLLLLFMALPIRLDFSLDNTLIELLWGRKAPGLSSLQSSASKGGLM